MLEHGTQYQETKAASNKLLRAMKREGHFVFARPGALV
jgi:hypothetical protein